MGPATLRRLQAKILQDPWCAETWRGAKRLLHRVRGDRRRVIREFSQWDAWYRSDRDLVT